MTFADALKDNLLKGVSGLLAASCILANCPSMAATAVSPQVVSRFLACFDSKPGLLLTLLITPYSSAYGVARSPHMPDGQLQSRLTTLLQLSKAWNKIDTTFVGRHNNLWDVCEL